MQMSRKVSGQIPEWPNGADCKSAVFRLRWFESIFAHSQLMTRQERESKRFSLSFSYISYQHLDIRQEIYTFAILRANLTNTKNYDS